MKKILTLRGQRKKKIPIEAGIWFSAPSPPWIDLPADLTANILHRLGPVEILKSARKVCATWWRVCKDPYMWRVIHMFDTGHEQLELFRYFATMKDLSYKKPSYKCQSAVLHRCQGGLIDFSVGYFCTEYLLRLVCERGSSSGRLKRLTIVSPRITSWSLKSAPIRNVGAGLEELRLFYKSIAPFDDMETIGICCPMLNTLALNHRFLFKFPPEAVAATYTYNDRCALAIGKNMPNLRHLELLNGNFSEKGLQAILDGCPRLESLNLRRSRLVGLEEGDLRKRCSRIKDVKLPCDSAWLDDYELEEEEEEEYDRQEGDQYRLVHIPATNEDAQMNCRTVGWK